MAKVEMKVREEVTAEVASLMDRVADGRNDGTNAMVESALDAEVVGAAAREVLEDAGCK